MSSVVRSYNKHKANEDPKKIERTVTLLAFAVGSFSMDVGAGVSMGIKLKTGIVSIGAAAGDGAPPDEGIDGEVVTVGNWVVNEEGIGIEVVMPGVGKMPGASEGPTSGEVGSVGEDGDGVIEGMLMLRLTLILFP